jgi:hypothetical protein
MKAPAQTIRIKKFDNSTPAQLIANVKFDVIFDFTGYDMNQMMELISGGQPPRVAYQTQCRMLNDNEFCALEGTTQVVMVRDLYANTGQRKGIGMQTAYLRMQPDARAAFVEWALEHSNDPVLPKPEPKDKG